MCVGAILYRVLERLWILVSRRGPGISPLWTLRGNWCSEIWGRSKVMRGFSTALWESAPLTLPCCLRSTGPPSHKS